MLQDLNRPSPLKGLNMLDRLHKLVALSHQFRRVERNILLPEGGNENDQEHSFQLALIAWYVVTTWKLPLDLAKVFKHSICHDLPEYLEGDRDCFEHDPDKKDRERRAINKIWMTFPEFGDLHTTIKHYEEKKDEEALFVYSLDKIVPILNIMYNGCKQWHKEGRTLQQLLEQKDPKATRCPHVKKIYEELVAELRKNESSMFPTTPPG